MAKYRVEYIEQSDQNRGLRKLIIETDDANTAQAALDDEAASNGDKDRTHYEVIVDGNKVIPEAKTGNVIFRV